MVLLNSKHPDVKRISQSIIMTISKCNPFYFIGNPPKTNITSYVFTNG